MRNLHHRKSGPGRAHRQGDGRRRVAGPGGRVYIQIKRGRPRCCYHSKLNFRRTDPRHPMYDALRARGWVVHGEAGKVWPWCSHDGKDRKAGPVSACRPIDAMRFDGLRIPACMRGAA